MQLRFEDTRHEGDGYSLRLMRKDGSIILSLSGIEIEDAIHAGFIDPQNLHYSLFDFARMRGEVSSAARTVVGWHSGRESVEELLRSLDLRDRGPQ